MKVKLLFSVSSVFVIIMFCLVGCSSAKKTVKKTSQEEFWSNSIIKKNEKKVWDGKILLYKKELKEWTTKELEDKLPNYIKKVMIRNKLIPLKYDTVYFYSRWILPSLLITYIDEKEYFKSNPIAIYGRELDFPTIHSSFWDFKKKAEAFFSPITGKLLKLKIRTEEDQWITIYNLENQIKT
ncbi:MAG: hypothetical protein QGH85_00475 [Candidatus Pacebacteria bacterium]|jgi:hypothetical protein|nr:hypothetical protein [Parcubacteria group bacterium]MDP6249240.1 hypothetical protein [Candidatus Paceibacterota bacterium]MDP7159048.1 hypothetical protein [Candidatus Paceibacterota bacterium]MDP7366618.1 hypothetical protein [Candidatus Paceibacterota bacterium]MDP7466098.1 hypothetical protein [Candidatus Paceibacterota bacterium]|tara:strand:+ start:22540 stop:23085 length:546 start_codon:yes stop_codon:yes gene_type:complete